MIIKSGLNDLLGKMPARRKCLSADFFAAFLLSVFVNVAPALAEEEVTNYFSDTYQEARSKFLIAAKAASAGLEHYRTPVPGAEGE